MAQLEIKLLGGFSVVCRGQAVSGSVSDRAQALLAYLILHRDRAQSRQRLAGLFWPESSDAQARTNLRRELHALRRFLPEADRLIDAQTKTLQWCADGEVALDVATFEAAIAAAQRAPTPGEHVAALHQAADCYRGRLLPTCDDDWILPEQERFEQRAIAALTQLVEGLQAQGDDRAAIARAQQCLHLAPIHEIAYRQLMALYRRVGDRAAALKTYHQCAERLREDLGVEPDPSTQALFQEILRADAASLPCPLSAGETPSSKATAQSRIGAIAPVTVSTSGHESSPQALPLVGRATEWAMLTQWSIATAPPQQVVLLQGEPGIGKTRLLEELARDRAHAGAIVLWGRGFEAEGLRPYGVWQDLLREVTVHAPEALPPELAVLMPHLGPLPEAGIDRGRLFDSVVTLLTELGDRAPAILLIFDDVQWLDEASLALLHYAIRLLQTSPVQFAWAARAQDIEHNASLTKVLQALTREHRLLRIEINPLDQSHTVELIQRVNDQLDGEQVFLDSGGNPLFALEMAQRTAGSDSPLQTNLEMLIRDRLHRLNEESRSLLPWAAALGRRFHPDTLAAVTESPLMTLLSALEHLEHQGIIRPSPYGHTDETYDFVHDIVRQVAYEQFSKPRRRLVHLHIARTLQRVLEQTPPIASDIAYHAALGGDPKQAASAYLRAAEESLKVSAYTEAFTLSQAGLRQSQRLDDVNQIHLSIALLKVQIFAGIDETRRIQLRSVLTYWLDQARQRGLADAEASAHEGLTWLTFDSNDVVGVTEHSFAAARTIRAASPDAMARILANSGSCLAEIEREMTRAEALLLEAQSLADRLGVEYGDIFAGLGAVRRYQGRYPEAAEWLSKALTLAQRDRDYWRQSNALLYLAMTALDQHDYDAAIAHSRALITVADSLPGEGSEAARARAIAAAARYGRGEPNAPEALSAAIATLWQVDAKRMLAYVQTFAAQQDLAQGKRSQVQDRATEALACSQAIDHASGIAIATCLLIQVSSSAAAVPHLQLLQALNRYDLSAQAQGAIAAIAPDPTTISRETQPAKTGTCP